MVDADGRTASSGKVFVSRDSDLRQAETGVRVIGMQTIKERTRRPMEWDGKLWMVIKAASSRRDGGG